MNEKAHILENISAICLRYICSPSLCRVLHLYIVRERKIFLLNQRSSPQARQKHLTPSVRGKMLLKLELIAQAHFCCNFLPHMGVTYMYSSSP